MRLSDLLSLDIQIMLIARKFNIDADIDEYNDEGLTPLMYLCMRGCIEGVKMLLDNGADPIRATPEGRRQPHGLYPLFVAANMGHIECLKLLIGKGAPTSQPYDGGSPLMITSQNGHLEVVKELLLRKVDPNFGNGANVTPLHVAVQAGHFECARALLNAKANPNIINKQGFSVLMYVFQGKKKYKQKMKCVKLLVQNGADINFQAPKDSQAMSTTPLHLAVQMNAHEAAKYLLEMHANPNIKDTRGFTPLLIAIANNLPGIGALLIKHNAKLFLRYDFPGGNLSSIGVAINQGNFLCTELLLKELHYALTIKFNNLQGTEVTRNETLKKFITQQLGSQNLENINTTLECFVSKPIIDSHIPRECFLTSYNIIRVLNHIRPKTSLPTDLIGHILSFLINSTGLKRQDKLKRSIYPVAIDKAREVSKQATAANIKLLSAHKSKLLLFSQSMATGSVVENFALPSPEKDVNSTEHKKDDTDARISPYPSEKELWSMATQARRA